MSGAPEGSDDLPGISHGIVDWRGTARRMGRIGVVVVVGVLGGWLVSGLLGGGLQLSQLGDWVGLGLGVIVLSEMVVVGGAAVRAERRAAVRGERLASHDVGLLPPRMPAAAGSEPGQVDPDRTSPDQSERS